MQGEDNAAADDDRAMTSAVVKPQSMKNVIIIITDASTALNILQDFCKDQFV